jgi:hypothetical protein
MPNTSATATKAAKSDLLGTIDPPYVDDTAAVDQSKRWDL